MRDEIAPFLAVAPGLVFVVEDGGCDAAGEGPEDEPVPAGKAGAYSRYAWQPSILSSHIQSLSGLQDIPIILKAGFPSATAAFGAVPLAASLAAALVDVLPPVALSATGLSDMSVCKMQNGRDRRETFWELCHASQKRKEPASPGISRPPRRTSTGQPHFAQSLH